MDIHEIYQQLSELEISNQRTLSKEYLELVFFKKDIKKWDRVLSEVLGSPVKPYKKNPSKEHKQITKSFGGIRWDQTLYVKDFGEYNIIAMLWPWQDKTNITLKMPLIKNQKPA